MQREKGQWSLQLYKIDYNDDLSYLLLLELVLFLDPRQDLRHVRLQHHAAHDQLVEDEVDLQQQ